MKVTFDREKLKDKVLLNCNILETKDIISNSISSIISVEIEGNEVSIASANNGTVVKNIINIKENIEERTKFTVNGISLKNIINSFNCSEITMVIKEEKLIFKNKKQRYTLSYRTDVYFPEVETGNPEMAEKIDREEFLYMLDKVLFCVSTSKESPALSNVWFGDKVILSGDNERFTKIKNKVKAISDTTVPSSVLKEIKYVLDKNKEEELSYYTDGSVLFFMVGKDYFISCKPFNEDYPSFIGDDINVRDKKVILDSQTFLDGIKFISTTINSANHRLFLVLKEDSLVLFTETDIFDGYNEIPVIAQKNTEYNKLNLCINYNYLLDITSKIKDINERILIEYGDGSEPINIRANNEHFIHSIATIEEKPKDEILERIASEDKKE